MSAHRQTNTKGKPVAVVIGATSKWQSDGRNTRLAHGSALDDSQHTGWRALGRRRCHCAEIRPGRVFRRAHDTQRGKCRGIGSSDQRTARRMHDCRAGFVIAGVDYGSICRDTPRCGRTGVADLQRGLSGRSRPAIGEGTAGIYPCGDVRHGPSHRQPRTVPGRQGSIAGDAAEGRQDPSSFPITPNRCAARNG